jgi:hypothetical protein
MSNLLKTVLTVGQISLFFGIQKPAMVCGEQSLTYPRYSNQCHLYTYMRKYVKCVCADFLFYIRGNFVGIFRVKYVL